MAKKANPFGTWCKCIEARGVVAVPPPSYMRDWPGMEKDMLTLLGMSKRAEVKLLAKVAFGRGAVTSIAEDSERCRSILIWPSLEVMVCIDITVMWVGKYARKPHVTIILPELELRNIDGQDLGWARWFKRQMPRVSCYYPGCD